jgi:hypothetical protein
MMQISDFFDSVDCYASAFERAAKSGFVVHVPPGDYKIQRPIVLNCDSHFSPRLCGSGQHLTKITCDLPGQFAIDRPQQELTFQNGLLENFSVINTGKNGGGIRLRSVHGAMVRSVHVSAYHGFDFHPPGKLTNGSGIFHVVLDSCSYRNVVPMGADSNRDGIKEILVGGTPQNEILNNPMMAVGFATRGHCDIRHPNIIQAGVGILATHAALVTRPRIEQCVEGARIGICRSFDDVGGLDPYTTHNYASTVSIHSGNWEEHIVGLRIGSNSGLIAGNHFFGSDLVNAPELKSIAGIIVDSDGTEFVGNRLQSHNYSAGIISTKNCSRISGDLDFRNIRSEVNHLDDEVRRTDVLIDSRTSQNPIGGISLTHSPGSKSDGKWFYFIGFDSGRGTCSHRSDVSHGGPFEVDCVDNQLVSFSISNAAFSRLENAETGRFFVGRGRFEFGPDGIWYLPNGTVEFTDDFVRQFDFTLANLHHQPVVSWGQAVAAKIPAA